MAKRHTRDRAEPHHKHRANIIRAARLYRPVTNSAFVAEELRRVLGRNGTSSAIIPSMELDMCKEGYVTGRFDDIGPAELRERAGRILQRRGKDGFIFKADSFAPHQCRTYGNGPVKHMVVAVPSPETGELVREDVNTVQDILEFPHRGFYGGLAIAACFGESHAREISLALNEHTDVIQRIGIVLGPMQSKAPEHL